MMTYDGFRVLMIAEDNSRCCFGLFGPLFQPYNVKIRQYACFFHCAFEGNAPGRRNIPQKLKNNEKLDKKKIEFLKIENIVRIDAPMYFWRLPPPEYPQDTPKTRFIPIFF